MAGGTARGLSPNVPRKGGYRGRESRSAARGNSRQGSEIQLWSSPSSAGSPVALRLTRPGRRRWAGARVAQQYSAWERRSQPAGGEGFECSAPPPRSAPSQPSRTGSNAPIWRAAALGRSVGSAPIRATCGDRPHSPRGVSCQPQISDCSVLSVCCERPMSFSPARLISARSGRCSARQTLGGIFSSAANITLRTESCSMRRASSRVSALARCARLYATEPINACSAVCHVTTSEAARCGWRALSA